MGIACLMRQMSKQRHFIISTAIDHSSHAMLILFASFLLYQIIRHINKFVVGFSDTFLFSFFLFLFLYDYIICLCTSSSASLCSSALNIRRISYYYLSGAPVEKAIIINFGSSPTVDVSSDGTWIIFTVHFGCNVYRWTTPFMFAINFTTGKEPNQDHELTKP
jgi:hypothetical protein